MTRIAGPRFLKSLALASFFPLEELKSPYLVRPIKDDVNTILNSKKSEGFVQIIEASKQGWPHIQAYLRDHKRTKHAAENSFDLLLSFVASSQLAVVNALFFVLGRHLQKSRRSKRQLG